MKWIKLFESFVSDDDKIDAANKIHAEWVVKKFLDNSGLSILKGTREEHLKSGSYVITETYYYKKVAGKDKLLICLVEGGMAWDPYQKKIKTLTKPNIKALCMNKSFRTSLLANYLKSYGKTFATINDIDSEGRWPFWYYCEWAGAKYFGIDKEEFDYLPIRMPSEKNFEKLISEK